MDSFDSHSSLSGWYDDLQFTEAQIVTQWQAVAEPSVFPSKLVSSPSWWAASQREAGCTVDLGKFCPSSCL